MGDSVGPGVVLGQGQGAEVAIDEGDVPPRPGALPGKDAVGPAAAAQVEDALALLDLGRLHQRPRPVVEPAVGEGAGPRQEPAGSPAADLCLEGDLVTAPRPVAVAMA